MVNRMKREKDFFIVQTLNIIIFSQVVNLLYLIYLRSQRLPAAHVRQYFSKKFLHSNLHLTSKMSQGTLYANTRIRAVIPTALVKHFNLDVKIVDPAQCSEFANIFPLGKVPTFVGPKGVKLTEVIAISVYCMY